LEADAKVKESEIDLLFLDINMPYLNGIDFLEQLENPPLCILQQLILNMLWKDSGFRWWIIF
jgi:two-component SAPR family response regulator